MPFVAMNDYTDGLDEMRLAMRYGLPKSYPLGINGLGDALTDAENTWDAMVYSNKSIANTAQGKAIEAALSAGDGYVAKDLILKFNQYSAPTAPPASAAPATPSYNWTSFDPSSILQQNYVQPVAYRQATAASILSTAYPQGRSGATNPPGTGSKITEFFDGLTKLFTTAAPAFKGRGGKGKTVIQRDPDYTTYAVIGGAVIVASVLAIAVGKSGRRDK